MQRTSIGSNLSNKVQHAGGFIWKKFKLGLGIFIK
jgi:hypothetical protein